MKLFDAHTHTHLRGPEDLDRMAAAGIERVVVCAFLPVAPGGPGGLGDVFRWLAGPERERLAQRGLTATVALGIHPRCIPQKGVSRALALVERALAEGQAQALGEVGLETASLRERDVLAAQLRLANRFGVPVVLHTPRSDKAATLTRLLALVEKEGMDAGRLVVDHLTPDLVGQVLATGAAAGLTLQPGKLSPSDLVSIVERHGARRLVANSDLSHAPSDPLAVARAAEALCERGLSAEAAAVCGGNARRIFGPGGKLRKGLLTSQRGLATKRPLLANGQ